MFSKKYFLSLFVTVVLSLCMPGKIKASESQFLYVINSNAVVGYEAVKNGRLKPITGSPFPAGTGPSAIIIHPTGKFAYVANKKSHNIAGYKITNSGVLMPFRGHHFPAGTTPMAMAIDSAGQYLYVLNIDSQNISAFHIDPHSGSLKQVKGSPFGAGSKPTRIAINGRFLYALNSGSNNISVFYIQESGALQGNKDDAVATGTDPAELVFAGIK